MNHSNIKFRASEILQSTCKCICYEFTFTLSQRSILIGLCSDVHYVNQRYTFVVIGREIVWGTKKKGGGGTLRSRDHNAFENTRSIISFNESWPQKVLNGRRLRVGGLEPHMHVGNKLSCIVHNEEGWVLYGQAPGHLNTRCDVRPQSLAILKDGVVV